MTQPGGLSKTRLARLHDSMAGYVDRGEVPGVVTVVCRRGEVHFDAVGTKAVGGGGPMQRDTLFRISSMTKPFLAAATMILAEECRVRLDEPVERLLPELAHPKVLRSIESEVDDTVPANRPITVRDVLTFRLGTGLILAMPGTYPIQKATDELMGEGGPIPLGMPEPDEWIRRLGTLPLIYQPGERWMYHTAADVLAVLIARASGQALEVFLQERLFGPLGMKDTSYVVPAEKLDRLSTSYVPNEETGGLDILDPAEGGFYATPYEFPSEVVSTADDLLAFGQMMLKQGRHGRERILSRLSVEAMTTDQLTSEQRVGGEMILGENRGWGFGMSVVNRRDDISSVPGRFGWDGGLGTSWSSDPHEEMIGILLTQRAWTSPQGPDIWVDFWNAAYAAIDD